MSVTGKESRVILRQAEISAVPGTTQQVYSRYENGVSELPIRHLITLCRYCHVSADDVLGLKRDCQQVQHDDGVSLRMVAAGDGPRQVAALTSCMQKPQPSVCGWGYHSG